MKLLRYSILIICLPALLLSSCKVGRQFSSVEMADMPSHFSGTKEDPMLELSVNDIGWSTLYKDPVLQNLIDEALENNKDILIAIARIKEMIANKRISFAPMLPNISLEAGGQKEMLNYGGDNKKYDPEFRTNISMGWEIDIWGNLRWKNEAAVAAYMQSVEAQRALHLTIVAQVAQAYFELRALDRQLTIVRQTLISREQAVQFAKLRYEGGLTSEIPYRQSLVELARTETLVPDIENEIKLKENDLAILVGNFPSSAIPRGQRIDEIKFPPQLPVDLPSTLLRRRPDILQAEQRLIEKNAGVGAALTDRFPKLQLTGRLGGESDELGNFLESPTWFISGLLSGPVFNFGKNKARQTAAQAAYEAEVHAYEKTVLNVFAEVNNAISSLEKAKTMRLSHQKLYDSANSYHQLAQLQYINGIVSYLDVLDSQRQLFDAEIALNAATLNELIATVNMYKSLGGGVNR
ncbi:efflux transporter outer membrane subunit [Proteiniphilum sp. UBA5384]|uniref:efflux transporter outer membrane subunit n=1 Tax=Proteiniphilum sp. UBA5384 TaxID=1947279 RepID=UPI0025F95804|nr:efflux transporter outer membrane subunit [Proteiniphilum sp. UBA5384]